MDMQQHKRMAGVDRGMAKAFLVALQRQGQYDWEVEDNLAELAELTADTELEIADRIIQKRTNPDPATFIGVGKVEEIAESLTEDDIVVFDDELSPAQQGNLSELLDAPVLDRTQLILDIFARRAHSKEGKIQVELAQLNYMLPRLMGQGKALSRLGGGIGTRGPGESKLEMDRRRIRKRISDLRHELDRVRKARTMHRTSRQRQDAPLVSLVGYTNAGKSTLLTALTGEKTYVADQMFATLDPLVRRWRITDNYWVYISDTVGFIRKLPHTLVAAFRATLDEVCQADLLLHVIDASHPQTTEQQQAVAAVLAEIGAQQDVIRVFNKIDCLTESMPVVGSDQAVSARTGRNLAALGQQVYDYFHQQYELRRYFFPFSQLDQVAILRQHGELVSEDFTEQGAQVTARVKPATAGRLSQYEEPR